MVRRLKYFCLFILWLNAAFAFIKTFPMDITQVLAYTLEPSLRVDAERQLNEVCLFDWNEKLLKHVCS